MRADSAGSGAGSAGAQMGAIPSGGMCGLPSLCRRYAAASARARRARRSPGAGRFPASASRANTCLCNRVGIGVRAVAQSACARGSGGRGLRRPAARWARAAKAGRPGTTTTSPLGSVGKAARPPRWTRGGSTSFFVRDLEANPLQERSCDDRSRRFGSNLRHDAEGRDAYLCGDPPVGDHCRGRLGRPFLSRWRDSPLAE